jgi:hypothetical protein
MSGGFLTWFTQCLPSAISDCLGVNQSDSQSLNLEGGVASDETHESIILASPAPSSVYSGVSSGPIISSVSSESASDSVNGVDLPFELASNLKLLRADFYNLIDDLNRIARSRANVEDDVAFDEYSKQVNAEVSRLIKDFHTAKNAIELDAIN